MKYALRVALMAAGLLLAQTTLASADVTVKISGLHNCCGGCLKGISKAIESAGAKAEIDDGDDTATITAADKETAQKAVDALAAAGYHGASDTPGIEMKDDSGAQGKVTRLELNGAHNCCKGCSNAIGAACKGVAGVTSQAITPKTKSFVVEGDFDAKELVKAINDAGFHVVVSSK